MDPLIGLLMAGAAGYALYRNYPRLKSAAQQRRSASAAHQQLNILARSMQASLATLNQTPDFQRACSRAIQAREVPLWFRQRAFMRFRERMIDHYATRLAAGENPDRLTHSLTTLVRALGMADFESDYIQSEAQQRATTSTAASTANSYEQQLRTLKIGHEQRLSALRSLEGIDAETRTQLVEAEQTRFRESVLRLGDSEQAE